MFLRLVWVSDRGTYMPLFLAVSCPAGQEDEDGACVDCPVGFYKNRTGALPCYTCPSGFRTALNGSVDEADCDVGKGLLSHTPFMSTRISIS